MSGFCRHDSDECSLKYQPHCKRDDQCACCHKRQLQSISCSRTTNWIERICSTFYLCTVFSAVCQDLWEQLICIHVYSIICGYKCQWQYNCHKALISGLIAYLPHYPAKYTWEHQYDKCQKNQYYNRWHDRPHTGMGYYSIYYDTGNHGGHGEHRTHDVHSWQSCK